MKQKPTNTVYISNLSYKRDQAGLRRLFSRYGEVRNIKIIIDPETNRSKGMAFVEMGTIEEAVAAIEGLNGEVIDGRTIKANFAINQKKDDSPTPSLIKKEKAKSFKDVQLAKKARNDQKRKSNPLQFKVPKTKAK